MKRILLTLLLTLLLISSPGKAEVQVLQVRRNIPLSDDEPVYKDYYLSGGSKNGLRVNLVVPVWRWVNLGENTQAQGSSMRILEPVGWLQLIFVQDNLSVARLYEPANFSKEPTLEQPGIMMGDVISLEHSYMSKSLKKKVKDSSTQIISPDSAAIPRATQAIAAPAALPGTSQGQLSAQSPVPQPQISSQAQAQLPSPSLVPPSTPSFSAPSAASLTPAPASVAPPIPESAPLPAPAELPGDVKEPLVKPTEILQQSI